MKNVLIVLVGLLICSLPVVAQTPMPQGDQVRAVDITGIQSGLYVLKVEGSQVSISPLQLLKPGQPTPDPTPDPDELTERGKAVLEAALDVTDSKRAETAQALAELYRQIGQKLKDGDIPNREAAEFAINFGTNQVLSKVGASRQAWQPVRDLITEQWTDVLQSGGSVGDYADLLGEVADGLNAAAPGNPQIDLQMIIMIIEMILEILKMLPFAG